MRVKYDNRKKRINNNMAGHVIQFGFYFALFLSFSHAKFVIERNVEDKSKSNSVSQDVFTNPGGCYRHNICDNLGAHCFKSSSSSNITFHCCKCECKSTKPYFYSLFNGCLTSKDILQAQTSHEACHFALKTSGKSKIPTFANPEDMVTELVHNFTSGNYSVLLSKDNIWCHPRRIYYFTRYGKERLIFENSCSEIFSTLHNGSITRLVKFVSRNKTDWDLQEGKLLKAEIVCKNLEKNLTTELSSCLLYRVNGSYDDEEHVVSHHSPKLCPPAPPYIPPPPTPHPPNIKPINYLALIIGLSVPLSIIFVSLTVVAVVCEVKRLRRKETLRHDVEVSPSNDQPFLGEAERLTNQDGEPRADEKETTELKVEHVPEEKKAIASDFP